MRRVFQPTLNPLQAADQTVQQTGTDTIQYVSPAVQQYHLSAAQAWAYVLLSGTTPVLMTGYNIATVSGPASGVVNFTFTNPMASVFYSPVPALMQTSAANSNQAYVGSSLTTVGFPVFVKTGAGTLTSLWVGMTVEVHGLLA